MFQHFACVETRPLGRLEKNNKQKQEVDYVPTLLVLCWRSLRRLPAGRQAPMGTPLRIRVIRCAHGINSRSPQR